MKICFFSPYIPGHFGGGEKHFFDTALVAAEKHTVTVAIPNGYDTGQVAREYTQFMGESLECLTFVSGPFIGGSFLSKLVFTRLFDAIYYVTDGSFFLTACKHRFLHVQIPFTNALTVWEKLKLHHWQHKNTNSQFTKQTVEQAWHTHIDVVHYPKVVLPKRLDEKKQKIILNVGRFFRHLHSKRQDVVVATFRKFCEQYPKESKGWKLVLVGNVEDEGYFLDVQNMSKGLAVEIHRDCKKSELTSWYKKAQIYWHATGYEVDELKNPEKVEHFGITTLEAMAYGVVPVVHKKGGQPEVVGEHLSAFLWNSTEECAALTAQLIRDEQRCQKASKDALSQARKFNSDTFKSRIEMLFSL